MKIKKTIKILKKKKRIINYLLKLLKILDK